MRPNADSDWLSPDESPSSTSNLKLPVFAGVYRVEAQGEDGVPYPSLLEAAAEAPTSPEAEIRGKGGCLAHCHPDDAAWVLTGLGKLRIAREAVAHDADAILGTLLAEDLCKGVA